MKRSTILSWLKIGALIFAASTVSVCAQIHEFQKYYGASNLKDVAKKIRGCTDYNYIMTGEAHENDPFYNSDLFLTRSTPNGTTVWTITCPARINGSDNVKDWGNSVVAASDGGFVAVGAAEVGGVRRAYIVKANSIGVVLWRHMYTFEGSAEFLDIIEDQGTYVVTGWTRTATGNNNLLLAKFSAGGVLTTHKVLDADPAVREEGRSITPTANGYAVTGIIQTVGVDPSAILLVETTPALAVTSSGWFVVPTPSTNSTWGNNIISTYDGGLMIVGGERIRAVGSNPEIHKGIIVKFDAQRIGYWVKEIQGVTGGASNEAFEAKEVFSYNIGGIKTGSTGFVIGGYNKGTLVKLADWTLVNSSGMLLKTNPAGSLQYSRLYKPSTVNPDQTVHAFYSIEGIYQGLYTFADKGVAAVGEAERVESNLFRDAWFAKTNGFELNIECYKDAGPEILPYTLQFLQSTLDESKPATTVLEEGSTGEYQPIQTICYQFIDIIGGKQGANNSPIDGLFRILPNPVRSGDELQMELNLPSDGNATVTITDMIGTIVYEGSLMISSDSELKSVNIPNLASGTYMVKVIQQGESYTAKLVITE